jgi:thiamine pyrophosphokinase
MARGAKKISVFAALERRTDHTLYNLHLLRKFPVTLFAEKETLFVLKNEAYIKTHEGQTLSLIPLDRIENVMTKGLKWELDSPYMSLSNVALGNEVFISVTNGDLLVLLSTG